MKRYLSSILLILTLPIGEIHSRFANSPLIQNWIINVYRPMALGWNVKKVEEEVIIIIYFGAWLLWRTNRINHVTVRAFFLLAIFDAILYFYNYKTNGFISVYIWFSAFWIISFHWKKITNWLWKKLKIK